MSHKITHREYGQGPLLVLLHGFGGSVHHWDGCVQELSKHYRVVVPNLAHIFMSTDRVFFSVQVQIVAQFLMQNFPNQKVHLAGSSFGGALAWALNLQYPKLVDRLILVNPLLPDPIPQFKLPELRYFFVMPMNTRAIYMLLSTPIGKAFLRRAASIFRDERSDGAGRLDGLKGRKLLFVSHLIYNFAWILRREDWSHWQDWLRKTPVRSLMIYDREDLLSESEHYERFSQRLACEKTIALNGAGHLAIKSRSETVSKHIHEYLSEAAQMAAS